MLLSPRLRGADHLCFSSEEVATRLRGIATNPRSIFLKYDVKDFYLAGEHMFIAQEVAAELEDRRERAFVKQALELMLTNQFVAQGFDPNSAQHTLYQVMQSSGIGMRHAGSVADRVFWRVVEKNMMPRRGEFGIR